MAALATGAALLGVGLRVNPPDAPVATPGAGGLRAVLVPAGTGAALVGCS